MLKRHTFIAIILLSTGSLLGAGLAFLTQTILARHLGAESFGVFSATLAMVILISPLAGFGVSQLWLKLYGEEGSMANRWLDSSFNLVITTTFLAISILWFWAFLGMHDTTTRLLILVLSFYILGQVSMGLVSSKLQLEERYTDFAAWQLLPHLTRFLLICLFAFIFTSWMTPENIAFIYASVSIVVTCLAIIQLWYMARGHFILKGHDEKQFTKLNIPTTISVLKNSWPFGLATFFYLIYYQSDIVLLKYMIGDKEAGIYNVAFTIIAAVYLFPGVVYQKYLLPKLHRWAHHDRDKFYTIYRKGNIAMLILGLIAMLIIWGLSNWGIPFLFGTEYQDAVILVNILAISAPIIFVAFSTGATLVTQQHMKRKVTYMGSVALINIVLNIILIPKYGAIGAASATVISNFTLLLLYYYASEKIVFSQEKISLKGNV